LGGYPFERLAKNPIKNNNPKVQTPRDKPKPKRRSIPAAFFIKK
jgi:hypothetical protein